MKWIAVICLVGIVGFIGLSTMLSGCGERTENSLYYYNPSWLRGGDVVLIKGLQSVRKDVIGTQLGSAYTETLITMDATGANEGVILDVTGNPPYGLSAAPAGDYLVYLDGLRNGLFSKAVILNIAAGTHQGLNKIEMVFNPGIKAIDWTNVAGKLVYCTTREIRTITLDGTDTLVATVADLSFVTWKNGTKLAYVHTVGGVDVLSLTDGVTTTDLPAAAFVDKPQISAANTAMIYGLSGSSYCSVDTSVGSPATTEVLASCKADLPRLNQAGDKVVYDRAGEQTGIYILDLTTKAETKIK
ncbi:MAG: hypothetical protein MUC35_03635 [Candidatus Margulisbacteria bacterium]|nr:hypothetical protein [Candidatus Margulisiibacteriota bacterium]